MPRLLTRAAPPLDAPFVANRDSVQARGLVGWWPLVDGSVRGRLYQSPLTLADVPTFVGGPLTGRGLVFDGTNDAASVAVDLSALTTLTLTCWLWVNAFTNGDRLGFEYSPNYNTFNGLLFDIDASSGSAEAYWSSGGKFNGGRFARPAAGEWHHYVLTFDRTVFASLSTGVYLDGAPQTLTNTVVTTVTGGNFANSTLYIMSRATTSLFLAGRLADLRLYDHVLPATEAWHLWAPQTRWELYRPSKWRTIVSVPAGGASQTLSPTAVGSEEQLGTPTLAASIALAPTAAGSDALGGTPALSATVALVPAGGASGEATGTPIILPGAVILVPTGAPSDAAGGTPVVTLGGAPSQAVAPTGAASSELAGSSSLTLGAVLVGPLGGASDGSAGTPGLTTFLAVLPVGAPSGEQGAIPAVLALIVLAPSAAGSGEQAGTPAAAYGAVAVIPLAAASLEVGGLPIVVGGVSGLATGSVTITVTLADGLSIATTADTMTTEVSA